MNIYQDIFIYFFNKDINENNFYYQNFFVTIKNAKHFDIKIKYSIINKHIFNNKLLSNHEKNILLSIFFKSQKIYFLIKKIINILKFKILKEAINEYDLNYTPIIELSNNNIIKVHENNISNFYIYKITDLITIINYSLINMEEFIINPKIL